MTKLTGKEYIDVKAELCELAQELGRETYNDEFVFGRYMAEHGIFKINDHSNTTVGDLDLNNGIYCVYCTNRNGFYHLFPVVDNIIYDRRNDSLGLYVIAVYKKESASISEK